MIHVQAARFRCEYIMTSEIQLNKGGFAQSAGREHQNYFLVLRAGFAF